MERKYKLEIPKPCHEDWDKMNPNGNGRFCLSCSKTVIDFTTMLPNEVQHFFIQNQNKNICGRFKKSQLDSITIQIPTQVLYSQTQYHKMFLLALFIAMGTTLFSCQDKDGKKQKIDKVEVVKTSKTEHIQVGDIKIKNNDKSNDIPPPPKTDKVKFEEEKKCSEKLAPIITMGVIIQKQQPFSYAVVYNRDDLDVLPTPENGMKQFYKFFTKNYSATTKGIITVLFVVEKDGTLSNFNLIKNTSKESGEEAIRVLKMGPKWIPGKRKNKIVRSSYTLSI